MPSRATDQPNGRRKPSSAQGHAQDAHPSSDNVDVSSMVDAMLKSTKQRRDAKRNALKNDYQASKTETRDSIDKNFSKHGKNVLIMHRGQLERLVELLERKEDIERQMAASVKTLEQAYLARAAELRAALNGRIEKLH